jgi:hypothetical protein
MAAEKIYLFNLSGARSEQGLVLKQHDHAVFVPAAHAEIKALDLSAACTTDLFESLDSFETLSVSPNGRWYLTGERVENQMYAEQIYTMSDSQGTVIRSFDYREVGYPQWLNDGNTLIYLKQTLQRREVWSYNAATGEKRLFWKAGEGTAGKEAEGTAAEAGDAGEAGEPQSEAAEGAGDTAAVTEQGTAGGASGRQRVVAITVDPYSGQVAIGAGGFNHEAEISVDVYLFSAPLAVKPDALAVPDHTYTGVSTYTCYEGPCAAWIQFIGKEQLFYTSMQSKHPQAYPEAFVLNTATGEKRVIDSSQRPGGYSQSRQVVADRNGGVYLRVDQLDNGNEAWKAVDISTGRDREWESRTPLLKLGAFAAVHLDEERNLLFFIKDHGWYKIDLKQPAINPYEDTLLPAASQISKIYGTDRNRLWFGTFK